MSSSASTLYSQLRIVDLDNDDGKAPCFDDTIHYMSPASSVSMHEDDYSMGYMRYIRKPGYGYPSEGSFECTSISTTFVEASALERTLAIIKPIAVPYEDVVLRKIQVEGFQIIGKRKIHLTPEQASHLYGQYYGDPSFPYLVVSMSSGPIIALCLAAVGAVEKWKQLVEENGKLDTKWFWPRCLRYRHGIMQTIDDALHASINLRNAKREVRFFFPQSIIEPLLYDEMQITDFLGLYVNPTLTEGLTEVCRRKPIEPLMYLAEWLLLHNPNQPRVKPEIAVVPT